MAGLRRDGSPPSYTEITCSTRQKSGMLRHMTRTKLLHPQKSIPAPAAYVRAVLRRFGTSEALRAQLLVGTDIDESQLGRSDAEVTLFTFISFSENLCRVVGEDWPLHAMEVWGGAMQGALEVAARSAETVADAMMIVARFVPVRGPFLRVQFVQGNGKARLVVRTMVPMSAPVWRALRFATVFSIVAILTEMLEGEVTGLQFYFPGPTPKYAEHVRRLLPGVVKFNKAECQIIVPQRLCDRLSPFADAALLMTSIADLDKAIQRIREQDTLPFQVEQLLRRQRTGRLNQDQVAKHFGLSVRTLVRRLSGCETSYSVLQDAHLKHRASRLLDEAKLTRDEAAEKLGFQDPTSFSRACRRWFK